MVIIGVKASKFDKKRNLILLAHIMYIAHFLNLYGARHATHFVQMGHICSSHLIVLLRVLWWCEIMFSFFLLIKLKSHYVKHFFLFSVLFQPLCVILSLMLMHEI